MTFSVQLDVAHTATLKEVNEFANQFDCLVSLITEDGPAGGNPIYEFSCDTYKPLKNLIVEFSNFELDEFELKTMILES